jgi:hypothetical protein
MKVLQRTGSNVSQVVGGPLVVAGYDADVMTVVDADLRRAQDVASWVQGDFDVSEGSLFSRCQGMRSRGGA